MPISDYVIGKPWPQRENSLWGTTTWRRNDFYPPTGNTDRLFAAGPDDLTPMYAHWEGNNYKAECSCCWLGFAHTEASHAQHLEPAHA